LYQQNTLRDAVSAAIALNIFNNHADRVTMANIAQTVNVLQAMILTEGSKMLLTPSYHVFDMFKEHQDALLLPFALNVANYAYAGREIPGLSVSASKNKTGAITVTIANPDPANAVELKLEIRPAAIKTVSARVLSSKAMQDYNGFDDDGEKVRPQNYPVEIADGSIRATLPAKSVVSLIICS
jgi:alpha-N-arabinofuranosidase